MAPFPILFPLTLPPRHMAAAVSPTRHGVLGITRTIFAPGPAASTSLPVAVVCTTHVSSGQAAQGLAHMQTPATVGASAVLMQMVWLKTVMHPLLHGDACCDGDDGVVVAQQGADLVQHLWGGTVRRCAHEIVVGIAINSCQHTSQNSACLRTACTLYTLAQKCTCQL